MTEPMKNDYYSSHLLEMVEHRLFIDNFLLKKSNVNIRDNHGKNALFWAIKNKSPRTIAILLKYNISLIVDNNLHALFHAIASDNLDALVYLVEKQSLNINMQNDIGQTLLMKALERESLMMVRYLVNYGADLYIMDDKYDMAIDYAKRCKNKDVFNLIHYKILYEELKINKKDCTGCEFSQSPCNETKES